MRYRILPYRQGSVSARALAYLLGGLVLRLENSKYRPRANDLIINWGNTTKTFDFPVLNPAERIKTASNKLNFFNAMKGAGHEGLCPRYFTTGSDIPDDAYPILCRTTLSGHSGVGIVIANTPDELVPAPLYVQYVKKQDEYRIHVGKRLSEFGMFTEIPYDEAVIISQQRKARRLAVPDDQVNWQIRNHSNGFVYTRGSINPPTAVVEAAKTALMATGLDFGAVDVIWNEHHQKALVLEVNTAPGLEGQTIADYAAFFVGDL